MCFQTIPVVSQPHSNITHRWQRNPANLRRLYIFYYTSFFLHGSLELSVSCQPNSSPLPRGAGWAAVLFRGGWHPDLSLWQFQHHLEKPYATDFHSLLASFDLKRLTTTSTHKSGNQLDLIYTRDCTADNILGQPLHISDHFFIKFTLHFATRVPPTPLPVTFRRNLRSLSPSHLSSVVSSSLPSPTHFSSLDVNAAT